MLLKVIVHLRIHRGVLQGALRSLIGVNLLRERKSVRMGCRLGVLTSLVSISFCFVYIPSVCIFDAPLRIFDPARPFV